MTVKELIDELLKLPQNVIVVLQKDSEGNGYSPVAGSEAAVYDADNDWSGSVYSDEDVADGDAPEGCPSCVVIFPRN